MTWLVFGYGIYSAWELVDYSVNVSAKKMKVYPTYVSKACAKSLWNEYRVYEDRVELQFRLFFKTFVIYYEDMISIALFDPPVIKTKFWALKLDWADFNKHVGIERKNGFMKYLRFTPQEPDNFVEAIEQYFMDGRKSLTT